MTDFNPTDYWSSRLADDYSLSGVGYGGLGLQYNQWLYRVRKHIFVNELRQYIRSGAGRRVLDIGSGTGFYLDAWQAAGAGDIYGSDLTEVAVQNLQARFGVARVRQLDVTEGLFDTEEELFSAVSMMDVLFHIVDDQRFAQALQNIYSVLEPGGVFVLSENFVHSETLRARHIVSRSLTEIEHALVTVGFQVERRRPMFFLMNAPMDTHNRIHQAFWDKLHSIVRRSEAVGFAVGATLFPFELALTRWATEGPSTEIMICRRPATPKLSA